MNILIFGHGYIGSRCADAWPGEAVLSDVRVQVVDDALREIDRLKPDVVLNGAGTTGRPNVDWCEDHQLESMRGNATAPMLMADACQQRGVYLLHVGSGCIFYGDSPHPDNAWRESDFGNPSATYSRAKYATDLVLSTLPNVGIARIRMPMDRIPSPRNSIDKVVVYKEVIDVANSVTVVDDMVDVFHRLLEKKAAGIFHVTNPGIIRHREWLEMYRELVDPTHACTFITEDELVSKGLAKKKRSTNHLASENLEKLGIHMRPVKEALRDTLMKYAAAKRQSPTPL
ncbi:sugar nucleotide-binding protein [Candidatus Uhrbacteria bacterium]|nr:sugar nucleotide-binding protein [Candidatus Uhrbacteria bacterium]